MCDHARIPRAAKTYSFALEARLSANAMRNIIEKFVAGIWNRLGGRRRGAWRDHGKLDVGSQVKDGEVTRQRISFSDQRRTMHVACLGITGNGKSSLIKHWISQDIQAHRGFFAPDFHGDLTEYVLRVVNSLERKHHEHLSHKLIVIDPTDSLASVGVNVLEQDPPDFVRISEIAQLLRIRWNLDHFGARTYELLTNALFALSASKLTLVELTAFLSNRVFRARCLRNVLNPEVKAYFETRYDQASEAMQATMREPILSRTTVFTSDPKLRHLIGQQHSTFSLRAAMDEGCWVIGNFPKGALGEHAFTLAGLFFTQFLYSVFAREKRHLFSAYLDEVQNIATAAGLDTVLAEGRKFGVGVVSANQFLDQHPANIRAAILSAATHVFFRLSSTDANQIAHALDGGKALAERLKNLPQRHCIVKSGPDRHVEVKVPPVHEPKVDYTNLLQRLHNERTRPRVVIERDIAKRHADFGRPEEVLRGWE